MGDGGLSVGCALLTYYKKNNYVPKKLIICIWDLNIQILKIFNLTKNINLNL